MKNINEKDGARKHSFIKQIIFTWLTKKVSLLTVVVILSCATLTLVGQAYNKNEFLMSVAPPFVPAASISQGAAKTARQFKDKLAAQPEVDRFRRVLGDRFLL